MHYTVSLRTAETQRRKYPLSTVLHLPQGTPLPAAFCNERNMVGNCRAQMHVLTKLIQALLGFSLSEALGGSLQAQHRQQQQQTLLMINSSGASLGATPQNPLEHHHAVSGHANACCNPCALMFSRVALETPCHALPAA